MKKLENQQSSVEKEFVPYEQALTLKELGFDEPCFAIIHSGGGLKPQTQSALRQNSELVNYLVTAPTFSQAFRWFREEHHMPSNLELLEGGWDYVIYMDIIEEINYGDGPFQTYEEAELACLRKLIEIANEQQ